jgi:transcription elongation factor GreB
MKNYFTAEGFRKIEQELHDLVKVQRPKTVQQVSDAAAMGDRSENAEYIYGKKRLREMDSRIRFLEKKLENFEVVDPKSLSIEKIAFGLFFSVLKNSRDKRTFRIVGVDEIDPSRGWITFSSPLGRKALGKKVGDVFEVEGPEDIIEYEVLLISRDPI